MHRLLSWGGRAATPIQGISGWGRGPEEQLNWAVRKGNNLEKNPEMAVLIGIGGLEWLMLWLEKGLQGLRANDEFCFTQHLTRERI